MIRRPSLPALVGGPARCEFLFTAPFAALGGALYGIDLAGSAGAPPLSAAAVCAVALVVFVALQVSLEPLAVARFGGPDGRWGALVAYLWDVATGAVVGFPS